MERLIISCAAVHQISSTILVWIIIDFYFSYKHDKAFKSSVFLICMLFRGSWEAKKLQWKLQEATFGTTSKLVQEFWTFSKSAHVHQMMASLLCCFRKCFEVRSQSLKVSYPSLDVRSLPLDNVGSDMCLEPSPPPVKPLSNHHNKDIAWPIIAALLTHILAS